MESNKRGGLSASFAPPEMLIQSRAIDQNNLRLSISVNQSVYSVPIQPGADTSSLTIPIERGQKLDIVVTWSELYNEILLPLAQAKRDDVTVPIDGDSEFSIDIGTDRYWTGYDYDKDLISNLDERNADRNPIVFDVLEEPIINVPVKFMANIPERLKNVDGNIDDSLTAFAIFDRVRIRLNREGDIWVGETVDQANSEALINYSFYSTTRPSAKLAEWGGTVNLGEAGATVDISSNQYSYEFDRDGDGKDNLEEVVLGTNPEDKNDPKPDPCLISNFEPGCDRDTDGDDKPDSVETETADADGDSIPDYQESVKVDADRDGANAEIDRDENNPCIPSDQVDACENIDSMEPPVEDPPILEPPEASLLSYNYYEGTFANMPDFDRLTVERSGTAENFSLPPSGGEKFYALQFSGQLFVAETGVYTFYSESNDGSLVYIDGNVVVDNDGSHALLEMSGETALSAGLHDIVVEYFQNNGSEALAVSWSSSTIDKQVIPDSLLFKP